MNGEGDKLLWKLVFKQFHKIITEQVIFRYCLFQVLIYFS